MILCTFNDKVKICCNNLLNLEIYCIAVSLLTYDHILPSRDTRSVFALYRDVLVTFASKHLHFHSNFSCKPFVLPRYVFHVRILCTLLRVTLSALINRYVLLFNSYFTIYERKCYILTMYDIRVTCTHGRWPYV